MTTEHERARLANSGMRRVWNRLKEVLATHPRIAVAYCAYTVWTQFALLGPLFVQGVQAQGPLAAVVPYAVAALVCAAIALAFKRWRFAYDKRWQRLGTVAAMVLGTLSQLAYFVDVQSGGSVTRWFVGVVAIALTTLGLCFYRIEIDRALGWVGAQKTFNVVVAGSLFVLPVVALVTHFIPVAGYLVAAVLPVVSFISLDSEVKDLPVHKYFAVDKDIELPIPMRFIATSFVQGVASGVLLGLACAGYLGAITVPSSSPTSIAGWAIGAVTVLAMASLMRLDYNRLVYKVGFPLLAAQFVIMGVAPEASVAYGLEGSSATVFMDLVLWSLGAFIIKSMGVPVCWIASFPGAALFGGTAMGAFVVQPMAATIGNEHTTLLTIAFATACFLLLSSLLLLSEKNIRSGWGAFKPGTREGFSTSLETAVSYLAGEHSLTPREVEVIREFAEGLTKQEAAETLGVSEETVKTHLRSIYRKTGVHSQTELVSLVEQTRKSMGSDDA